MSVHAPPRRLAILGTRGIPAAHGGFETFAERFAPYLVERGWAVRVYCQAGGGGEWSADRWHGVERVTIPVADEGPWGTIVFDWKSIRHACREGWPMLTLGYNTAAFAALSRLSGCRNVMNMDGIEWKRAKWSRPVRAWFWLNEILGCLLADHLVADHPLIADHLARHAPRGKIAVIAYGADRVADADPAPLAALGLEPGRYCLVIARPEPENSILDMVSAFGVRPDGMKLVVLGDFRPGRNRYHRQVLDAAGPGTVFPGAIYDAPTVRALRVHARLYLHGHRVGGTNPSLVEALGCGAAVLAHDNGFNRWVAGEGAHYFAGRPGCAAALDRLLADDGEVARMRAASVARHEAMFRWEGILAGYERVCSP